MPTLQFPVIKTLAVSHAFWLCVCVCALLFSSKHVYFFSFRSSCHTSYLECTVQYLCWGTFLSFPYHYTHINCWWSRDTFCVFPHFHISKVGFMMKRIFSKDGFTCSITKHMHSTGVGWDAPRVFSWVSLAVVLCSSSKALMTLSLVSSVSEGGWGGRGTRWRRGRQGQRGGESQFPSVIVGLFVSVQFYSFLDSCTLSQTHWTLPNPAGKLTPVSLISLNLFH